MCKHIGLGNENDQEKYAIEVDMWILSSSICSSDWNLHIKDNERHFGRYEIWNEKYPQKVLSSDNTDQTKESLKSIMNEREPNQWGNNKTTRKKLFLDKLKKKFEL